MLRHPDADEYNAVTAAVTDNDGHRVYFYPVTV